MPNKPDKYGMKIWILADSETKYIKNFQVYLGKIGSESQKDLGKNVVMDLSSCLQPGHNITVDNFFCSYSLGQQLLKKNLTLLGTIRKNRHEVPKSYAKTKDRELYSSIFAFTDTTTLVSYLAKKSKIVLLLSTMHHDNNVQEDEKRKPEMILDYNKTKVGVDVADQMMKHYSVKRATRRWTLALFYNFIDMAALNAYIVWSYCHGKDKRRHFLESLINELKEKYMTKRSAKRVQPLPSTSSSTEPTR